MQRCGLLLSRWHLKPRVSLTRILPGEPPAPSIHRELRRVKVPPSTRAWYPRAMFRPVNVNSRPPWESDDSPPSCSVASALVGKVGPGNEEPCGAGVCALCEASDGTGCEGAKCVPFSPSGFQCDSAKLPGLCAQLTGFKSLPTACGGPAPNLTEAMGRGSHPSSKPARCRVGCTLRNASSACWFQRQVVKLPFRNCIRIWWPRKMPIFQKTSTRISTRARSGKMRFMRAFPRYSLR